MAFPGLSEALTTTLRNRAKKVRDAVSMQSALFNRMKQEGMVRPFSGGRSIVTELEYRENDTLVRYNGYEYLNIAPQDHLTAAEYTMKQMAMAVTISGTELLQNSGKEQIIDLLESRINNCEKSFHNGLVRDSYSDGTAAGGRQINGLRNLVSDTGMGVVGGIDANMWPFWRNKAMSIAAVSGGPASPTTIQTAMNKMYVALVRNRDKPDLIVADNDFYLHYLSSLQAIQRITNTKLAEAGFENLKFMGADVVMDGGMNGAAPASHMYFLNTGSLEWKPHRDRNMEVMGGDREPVQQDALVRLIGWAGNFTTNNRGLNGVLIA
jgi:hypothetical protein